MAKKKSLAQISEPGNVNQGASTISLFWNRRGLSGTILAQFLNLNSVASAAEKFQRSQQGLMSRPSSIRSKGLIEYMTRV
ncbi:hypothetical protein [Coleofasciculus sp. E2-BRE-01]|uniref:hypothetical protein n=1 Tax=Coleofasciculus sp. E2-BRE-01 TaxID=3069524 RepID=UPI0032F7268B